MLGKVSLYGPRIGTRANNLVRRQLPRYDPKIVLGVHYNSVFVERTVNCIPNALRIRLLVRVVAAVERPDTHR